MDFDDMTKCHVNLQGGRQPSKVQRNLVYVAGSSSDKDTLPNLFMIVVGHAHAIQKAAARIWVSSCR
jgi:hypothetical protein